MAKHDEKATAVVEPEVDEAALKKAEEFIEQEEGATHRMGGWVGWCLTALAVSMSLFHLWAAYDIVPTTILRPVHVGFALVLIFLLFPIAPRFRNRIRIWDLALAAAAIATIWYLIQGGDELTDRASLPEPIDQWYGVIFLLLVLEAGLVGFIGAILGIVLVYEIGRAHV